MPRSILAPIVTQWMAKIRGAQEVKNDLFQNDADEAMRFFNGPYDWLYGRAFRRSQVGLSVDDDGEGWPTPSFRMTANKVAEMVQIFGPVLYYKNPQRTVTPRQFPQLPAALFGDPNNPQTQLITQILGQQTDKARLIDQTRAMLLSSILNYTPEDLGLKTEVRLSIDEAIIKGMGLLWTELYTPPGANFKMVRTRHDSVDNLVADPDAERQEDWKWIAQRCVHPIWEVEQKYGLPVGSLKGNRESWNSYAETTGDKERADRRARAETSDIIVYWKIWSKMGLGGRLSGVAPEFRQVLDQFGDYVHLVVAEHIDYPLNLPPAFTDVATPAQVLPKVQWETPFWREGGWPFTPIQFHPVPRQAWPMSHVKPGMGELKALNWMYSFMASRLKVTSRLFLGVPKSMDDDVMNVIKNGPDLSILELDTLHGNDISKMIQFIQHPEMTGDLYKAIEMLADQFEKRTGLSELMYGESQSQFRSAEEANVKQGATKVRPDDMLARVEDGMSEVGKKEAIASRYHLTSRDVSPVIGNAAGYLWDQFVRTGDPTEISRSLDYRVEADSTRKPNRERQAANMTQAIQTLATPYWQLVITAGQVDPWNELISGWAKSIDLDPKGLMISPPPPPPPMPPPGAASSPPQGAGNGAR